jgi:hypothetical protein
MTRTRGAETGFRDAVGAVQTAGVAGSNPVNLTISQVKGLTLDLSRTGQSSLSHWGTFDSVAFSALAVTTVIIDAPRRSLLPRGVSMSDRSVSARLRRLVTVNWRELGTAWKVAVFAGAAVLLLCCVGIFGSCGGLEPSNGPSSPDETTTETETSSPPTPSMRETTTRPEPTQVPTTRPSPTPSPSPAPPPPPPPPPPSSSSEEDESVYYENCDAARADGAAPLYEGDPGYAPHLDADGDGVACEPYFRDDESNEGGGNDGGDDGDGDSDTYYENCDAARADGAAPLHEGDPGYDDHLDRDGDGVACE